MTSWCATRLISLGVSFPRQVEHGRKRRPQAIRSTHIKCSAGRGAPRRKNAVLRVPRSRPHCGRGGPVWRHSSQIAVGVPVSLRVDDSCFCAIIVGASTNPEEEQKKRDNRCGCPLQGVISGRPVVTCSAILTTLHQAAHRVIR